MTALTAILTWAVVLWTIVAAVALTKTRERVWRPAQWALFPFSRGKALHGHHRRFVEPHCRFRAQEAP